MVDIQVLDLECLGLDPISTTYQVSGLGEIYFTSLCLNCLIYKMRMKIQPHIAVRIQ